MIGMNWVRIKKLSELSGYTENAIRAKIKKGVWLQGKHWRKAPDNRILISLREFEAWVEGKVA